MFLSPERKKRIKRLVQQRQRGLIIVLEDVFDPHNAAAIFRTCDGLGVQEIHLIFDKQKAFNPKKIGKNSSSSANKWVTFIRHNSAKECFKYLKDQGYIVLGSTLTKDAKEITKVDITYEKVALVMGNEHRGLSPEAVSLVDMIIALPMRGMVESFNVSVATALLLYEIIRQREGLKKKFNLSVSEQKELQQELEKRDVERKIRKKRDR